MSHPQVRDHLYALMTIEVMKLGQPTHYKEDFTRHDKASVHGMDDDETFFWVVRECGTHIFNDWSNMKCVLRTFSDVVALFTCKTGNSCFSPEVNRIPYLWMDRENSV